MQFQSCPMEESERQKNPSPYDKANIISRIFFWWLLPFLYKGYKRDIEEDDLHDVPKENRSEYLGDVLQNEWQKELVKATDKRQPSLRRAIWRAFGLRFMCTGILCFIEECGLHLAQPLCLASLLRYFRSDSDMTKEDAFFYASGLVLASALFPFTHHAYFFGVLHVGMKIRIASCSLIYRKAMHLSQRALGQTTIGQLVNLLSNDVNRFDSGILFLHYLWVGPIQVALCTWILWQELNLACLVGVGVLLMLLPFQSYMGKIFGKLRLQTAKLTDERIRVMNEVVSGMRVIKMYAWEKPFAALVEQARKREIRVITKTNAVRAINVAIFTVASKVILFLTLVTFILLGNSLTPEVVFVSMALYNNVRLVMTLFFPFGIGQAAEMLVSIRRLQNFLLLEERAAPLLSEADDTNVASEEKRIKVEDLVASWPKEELEKPTLNHISCEVKAGTLLAVVGPVGAGKTSLLMALLNELPVTSGTIQIVGKIVFSAQQPWVYQATVRQNILFGNPFEKARYSRVLRACSLDKDMVQLPYGDQTLVGEKGSTLSGGQKARISLARAVYNDADIYLLDDPLSAVDAAVGQHLFEKCIQGFLKNKIRILVTHQVHYLQNADQIMVLKEGDCIGLGTYEHLHNQGFDLSLILSESTASEGEKSPVYSESALTNVSASRSSKTVRSADSKQSMHADTKGFEDQKVVQEHKSSGGVSLKVYWKYVAASNCCFLLILLSLLFIITDVLYNGTDYWLKWWTNEQEQRDIKASQQLLAANDSNTTVHLEALEDEDIKLYIYTGIIGILFVLSIVRAGLFFYMCLLSSKNLHNKMFYSILRAPIRFFDENPSGRILNRFSRDIGLIDDLLPVCLDDCTDIFLKMVGIIILVALVNYWTLFPMVILTILFVYLRKFYIRSARDVKRLEGITRSPVFSHLSTSLHGLCTIRAFRAEEAFCQEFDLHQDLHSSAWFLFMSGTRWLGICLDWICIIYIALVTYSFLVFTGSMGGDVGLAITSALVLSGMFQWGVRQSAEVENQMTSVERVIEYGSIEPEASLVTVPDKTPSSHWPQHGIITFEGVSLRYSPDTPFVLKNIYCCFRASEKVGIIGRTGAGKSSMITALFRLTEPEGVIRVDGINIKELGLHDLRRKISIIPQDPIIFLGTLRYNLDPFLECSEQELWRSLEDVHLKYLVLELPKQLDTILTEGGGNLSVGQRQLLCLARAILRKNKIIVLDEATANVDQETDKLIQHTLRQKFGHCTVITIAHRLNTIMDSDRVMVLEDGKVAEFDEPHILLQNENSHLLAMVETTGEASAKHLKSLANKAYLVRSSPKHSEPSNNSKQL